MSTATDALVAQYQTLIDAMTDALNAAKAAVALEVYQGCIEAVPQITGRAAQSYSIAGRSFTFHTPQDAMDAADRAKAELEGLLGLAGGMSYVDLGGSQQ